MTVNTDNFDVNNWGEFVHKKALNDVIQQINQVDAEQNNAISKISDLANQASQNALNASKIANRAMQSATNAENTANSLKNDVSDLKSNAMMKDANAYSDFANVSATQVNGEAVQNFNGYFNHYKIHNVNGEEFERVEFSIGGMFNGDLSKIDVIQIDLDQNLLSETEWEDCHTLLTDTNGNQVVMFGGCKVYNNSIRINFDNHTSAINKLTGPYQVGVFCNQTRQITN